MTTTLLCAKLFHEMSSLLDREVAMKKMVTCARMLLPVLREGAETATTRLLTYSRQHARIVVQYKKSSMFFAKADLLILDFK